MGPTLLRDFGADEAAVQNAAPTHAGTQGYYVRRP
jgi:hypothetical protein